MDSHAVEQSGNWLLPVHFCLILRDAWMATGALSAFDSPFDRFSNCLSGKHADDILICCMFSRRYGIDAVTINVKCERGGWT